MERNVRDSVSCAAFKLRGTQPAAILSSQVARPALLTGEPVFLTGGLVLATHIHILAGCPLFMLKPSF